MATLVLGAVGTGYGGAIGGYIGSQLGSMIDGAMLGSSKLPGVKGPRLKQLEVQVSTYGKMIPILYGNARIAGNVIWSRPLKETASTNLASAGGGKGGGASSSSVKQSQTTYSYSATCAISICEGEIEDVLRVWANNVQINPANLAASFTLYKGTETQLPDSVIESFEGVGNAPAYRGQAYIVLEDFPLADYGNRIPNFTFEVKRKLLSHENGENPVEELISSIVMIPGSGEFVYDDTVESKIEGEDVDGVWVQKGDRTRINQHNLSGKCDALVSLDQLHNTLPNVAWVSVVVAWFGTSLDAGSCVIMPGVEFQTGATTTPDVWGVGSFTRDTAHQITLESGSPIYGGTPSDAGTLRYLRELKSRGYKVAFYPLFFMDVTDKPWRGRVTGSVADVAGFFTKTNGYNAFVNHYANLVKDDVDAFVIGSELVGLTSVQDNGDNSFPAVDALVSLASTVKSTVGAGVKVTYAADWSEYHHEANGWYNLDPLWASSDIDMVGIDAYFPLSDAAQDTTYDVQTLMDGWTSGEGYDWYYSDAARTTKVSLAPEYAWKNIQWWWENSHTNPDSSTSDWAAKSKPIWFMEYGFPSVDGASNQPNVFVDPSSSESAYPRFSKEIVDLRAQRAAITATELKWAGSSMIERMFLWTWDARPFPFWPDLGNVWGDGSLWKTGHWVQGKLGQSGLAAIVEELAGRVGLASSDVDVSRLKSLVEGLVLSDQSSAREIVDGLRSAFFFDAVESDGQLKFVPRGSDSVASIAENELIPAGNGQQRDLLNITRQQELELPQKVDVVFYNKEQDYQLGNQHAQRLSGVSTVSADTLHLPLVMDEQGAKHVADVALFNRWLARTQYSFTLPRDYLALEPTDVITVTVDDIAHTIRVTETQAGAGLLRVQGVAEDISAYQFYGQSGSVAPGTAAETPVGETRLEILDLPAFPSDSGDVGYLRFAANGLESGWQGATVFRAEDNTSYQALLNLENAATIGTVTNAFGDGPTGIFDNGNTLTVLLYGAATLSSATQLAVLGGSNVALVGDEIIQFKTATLVDAGKYMLSGLLRGRMGTEYAMASHSAGERFILLDNALEKNATSNALIGLSRQYKPVSIGETLAGTTAQSFTYNAQCLKPYAPVHISGERDGSGNLTISWIRRTRLNGEWRDSVDVPISERDESYEVDILSGSTVVRTISGLTSAIASYTAASQTIDFGSLQSTVSVKVYQLSEVVGRGRDGSGVV